MTRHLIFGPQKPCLRWSTERSGTKVGGIGTYAYLCDNEDRHVLDFVVYSVLRSDKRVCGGRIRSGGFEFPKVCNVQSCEDISFTTIGGNLPPPISNQLRSMIYIHKNTLARAARAQP